jgi:hypothetical protein
MNAEKRYDLAKYLTKNGTVQKEFRAAELFDAQPAWEDFKKQNKDEDPHNWIRRHEGEGGHGADTKAKMAATHDEPADPDQEIKSLEEGGKGGFLHVLGAEKWSDDEHNKRFEQYRNDVGKTQSPLDGESSERKASEERMQGYGHGNQGNISKERQEKASRGYEEMGQTQDKQNVDAFEESRSDRYSSRTRDLADQAKDSKLPFRREEGEELDTLPYDDDIESATRGEIRRRVPFKDKGERTLSEFRQVSHYPPPTFYHDLRVADSITLPFQD